MWFFYISCRFCDGVTLFVISSYCNVLYAMRYMMYMMTQITTNILRPLPPTLIIYFDPDEDEPSMEPTWPHLSVGGIIYSVSHVIPVH